MKYGCVGCCRVYCNNVLYTCTDPLIVQVNLKKGTITVPPGEPEVVQHICLAFVTATLYLLVQPRPPKIEEVGLLN